MSNPFRFIPEGTPSKVPPPQHLACPTYEQDCLAAVNDALVLAAQEGNALIYDEDGQLVNGIFLPVASPGTGAPSAPIASYEGQQGPLVPTDDTASAAQSRPIPVGGCNLFETDLYPIYDRDAAFRRYLYSGTVGVRCPAGRTSAVNCVVDITRRRDGHIFTGLTSGDDNSCVGTAATSRYLRRNAHQAVGTVTMTTARAGQFWGYGPGPRGWRCVGQGTRTLSCDDVTPWVT